MTDGTGKQSRLSQIDIFAGIPQEGLEAIERVIETRIVAAREMVFSEGDPGDSFCIVNSGRVRVFKKDAGGVEVELAIVGPGGSFGEMALFTGEPRSANVEALEKAELSVIPKDRFDEMLQKHPPIAAAFVKQMSKWVRQGDRVLQTVARRRYESPKLSWFDFIIIIGLSVVFALIFNQSNPNAIPIFPKSFSDLEASEVSVVAAMEAYGRGDALFVDARPSNFYDQEHIAGALNVPLGLFDFMYLMTLGNQEKTKGIIVYGRTISSRYDAEIASKLVLRGHKNISLLKGGLGAWKKKGYPVEP